MEIKTIWQTNCECELNYWKHLIAGDYYQKEWVKAFHDRLHGKDIAPSDLHEFLDSNPRVLDVGAGPCTTIGSFYKGKPINIVAIDPLAHEYKNMLEKASMKPCVETIFGRAENLQEYVLGKFDLIYAENSLDHSENPIQCILSMLGVLSDNGLIAIKNIINEGLRENYRGLHQWNFMECSNDLVIWDKSGSGSVLSHELPARSYNSIHCINTGTGWIHVRIRK